MRIRDRFPHDSMAWHIAWRTHETHRSARFCLRYRFPLTRAARLFVRSTMPYGAITGGTDCDGMRYAGSSLHWTRKAAQRAVDSAYDCAEGPCYGNVISGREAREFERNYEPDTRDRFAEQMGY